MSSNDYAARMRAEAAELIKRLAEPRPPADTHAAALLRACRRLNGWTYNRVRDVWREEPRIKIRAEELEQLRAYCNQGNSNHAGDELAKLRERIERLEHLIFAAKPADALGILDPAIWAAGSKSK